ncbi:MAG: prepilin peptidase, partial [Candidatus Aminicenantes bacterium]
METIIIIICFGLAWGSFLNVVIYRLPLRMSLSKPSSSCPHCNQKIKFYDNIPVLSFLLLRGKCRHCKGRISLRYPLVELLTAGSFLLLYSQYSLSFFFFASCLFACALIALGFIDFYHQILPDEITLPGLLLALIYSLFRTDLNLRQALIGAVAGAGFLLFIYVAYYLLRKQEGLGLGDVTMMLLIGAYLGWRQAFFTLILASFVGALVGIFFIFCKKKDFQYSLP